MASTYLTRNMTTQGSSIKGTFSCWFKLANDNLTGGLLSHYFSSSYLFDICMQSGHIEVADYRTAYILRKRTTAKYRDLNAWYHLYVAIDRSLATASDRCKIYVNGERVTDFQSSEDQDYSQQTSGGHTGNISMNNNYTARVGVRYDTTYFNGSISHMHWVDGSVIDISQFGSTDTTTGEWKINTNPTVADYGTNGFLILKDGNTITDQSSGGSYDFSVGGGTLTNTEDCPSNVFCTLNPLGLNADVTFANGNNNATYGTSGTRSIVTGTLGASSGKYYWECEIQGSVSANNAVLGVSMSGWETGYAVAGESNQSWGFRGYDGAVYNNNSSVGGTFATFTNGDIIGVAINLDDEQSGLNKLYFSKNGTWLNGADPSNPSSTTGVIGITKPENGDSGFYFPVISDAGSSATPKFKMNFGNGYFGSTAISSEGTNASGIGKFEYDVPTGFTALSTKGLNE